MEPILDGHKEQTIHLIINSIVCPRVYNVMSNSKQIMQNYDYSNSKRH